MHNCQMKTKILLIGGNGQVGHALTSTLQTLGEVVVCTRAELDLSVVGGRMDAGADCPIAALVSRVKPSIIVNATAYARSGSVHGALLHGLCVRRDEKFSVR
jgi:dTDP-4-dehydrorhamnose reductase